MENELFIVVEGPDGSGKSTLLEKLSKLYGMKVLHGGGPPKTLIELIERLEEYPNKGKILDRWSAISEQIYSPILGKDMLLPKETLDNVIDRFKPMIIYCRPPTPILEANKAFLHVEKAHKSKAHCGKVDEKFKEIVNAYDDLMIELSNKGHLVMKYDYTGGHFE